MLKVFATPRDRPLPPRSTSVAATTASSPHQLLEEVGESAFETTAASTASTEDLLEVYPVKGTASSRPGLPPR